MNELFLKSQYLLTHNKGKVAFDSLDQLDLYVSKVVDIISDIDLSSAKVFKVDIYSIEKSFEK